MQDDFISALTLEVKEEVIQNYLYERRLIEEQIHYAEELAGHVAKLQELLSCSFGKLGDVHWIIGYFYSSRFNPCSLHIYWTFLSL